MDQVYDSLNHLNSPDFFLALRVGGAPKTAPPGARLRGDLERWLGTLDWGAVRQAWEAGGFNNLPTYTWKHEDWNVLVQPIPKSQAKRGSPDIRPVALNMPLAVSGVTADENVKRAVQAKNKYGVLDLPFLVAINIMTDFCSQYDVMNGLFGHETVIFGPDGTRPGGRLHDGRVGWAKRPPEHHAQCCDGLSRPEIVEHHIRSAVVRTQSVGITSASGGSFAVCSVHCERWKVGEARRKATGIVLGLARAMAA
jgi:hypothetical protein